MRHESKQQDADIAIDSGIGPLLSNRSRTAGPFQWLLLGLVLVATPGVLHAGAYSLVDGAKWPLCRDFLENLNSMPDEPPMACGVRLNPKFSKFRYPDWEALNPAEQLPLIEELVRTSRWRAHGWTEEMGEQDWLRQKSGVMKQVSEGTYRISRATVDIDSDGSPEPIIRRRLRGCNFEFDIYGSTGNPWLRVLDARGKASRRYDGVESGPGFDVFLYDARIRLLRWDGSRNEPPAKPPLRLYEAQRWKEHVVVNPVCSYRYTD